MESPFSRIYEYLNGKPALSRAHANFFGRVRVPASSEMVLTLCTRRGHRAISHTDFGEDVHAADLGCHPELWALLNANHRRLAAHPALFSRGKFGWKD